jgi:hypothetical protein
MFFTITGRDCRLHSVWGEGQGNHRNNFILRKLSLPKLGGMGNIAPRALHVACGNLCEKQTADEAARYEKCAGKRGSRLPGHPASLSPCP